MTYYLIIFIIPKPSPDIGSIKHKLSRARFEQICVTENCVIESVRGNFTLTNKRIFSLEADNVACVVCDGIKNQRE